jgi:Domain of unknown function (DUF1877)
MCAQAVSNDKISTALSSPPLVWRIVDPDNHDAYLREVGQLKPPGFFDRLLGKTWKWPPDIPDLKLTEIEREILDVDKSWDGINYCLKQLVAPGRCKNFFEDGQAIGKVDVGYGQALAFLSQDIAIIASVYCEISTNDLLQHFVPSKMHGVYPEAIWRSDDEETREYLTENFLVIQKFLAKAAENRLGAILQYT